MLDFKGLIQREGERIADLHGQVKSTYKQRSKDFNKWKLACEAFHSYVSLMDEFIDRAYKEESYSEPELLEFSISFLEVNPLFFRSGYIKEELLRKLKRTKLNGKQIERLNAVLQDAVDQRGSREFKGYCRLAAIIATPRLAAMVENAAQFGVEARKSRAKLMLAHINRSTFSRIAMIRKGQAEFSGLDIQ
jgi:hypothetical protein